jgi:hypothetical protein
VYNGSKWIRISPLRGLQSLINGVEDKTLKKIQGITDWFTVEDILEKENKREQIFRLLRI